MTLKKNIQVIVGLLFVMNTYMADMKELSITPTPSSKQEGMMEGPITNSSVTNTPNNSTSQVTDWLMHHKKKAAIGLIIGVTIVCIILVIFCCVCTKVASEKVKRNKKKKGGVLRGLKKLLMPKFKMPKFFATQPKKNTPMEIKNIGSLTFSLLYENRTTELFIKIKKAENLSLKTSSEVSFNFVQAQLDPFTLARETMGEYYETKRTRNSVSPIFDDNIIIRIFPREVVDQTLNLFVYEENRISQRDLIGVACVKLENVYKNIYGKEKDFSEILKWRSGERGGDILLGLYWNPRDEILQVTIKECLNLSIANTQVQPNPYVKIELYDGWQRIVKKTTKTRSKTTFPVFNEQFHFHFNDEQKKKAVLIVSVKHKPGVFSKKCLIGQLSFSLASSIGEELAHWKSTLSGGTNVEMMHSLRPAVQIPRKEKRTKNVTDIIDVLTDEENLSETEEDRLL